MALVKCPECGREKVSDSADMCPDCGYAIKTHYDRIKREEEEKYLAEEREKQRVAEEEKRKQLEAAREKQHQENMDKYFGSPSKKIAWVFAVVFLIVIMATIFASENAKKCSFSGCDNYKIEGGDYCKAHTCRDDGCNNSKSMYDKYCSKHETAHQCIKSGCENERYGSGFYCSEHKCAKSGCTNEKGWLSDYCSTHTVNMRDRMDVSLFYFDLNSAGGIKLTFKARNKSGKEIKYVRFDITMQNAVGDRLRDDISDSYTIPVEIIGPIASGSQIELSKELVGYCDNCARIDIDDVTIVYMDGTSETGRLGYYAD